MDLAITSAVFISPSSLLLGLTWNIITRKLSLHHTMICGFIGSAFCGSVLNDEEFSTKCMPLGAVL